MAPGKEYDLTFLSVASFDPMMDLVIESPMTATVDGDSTASLPPFCFRSFFAFGMPPFCFRSFFAFGMVERGVEFAAAVLGSALGCFFVVYFNLLLV